jgi:hypothetical protein
MVPFPRLPTESAAERRLYEAFLLQLSDEYVVYHSVDWVLGPQRPGEAVVQGESDFLIAHPVDGLLVLEVKGGELSYDPAERRWFQSGHSGRHPLLEDPFHQARDEMHSLVDILSHQPGWEEWKPSFGYGVAFPDGRYDSDAHPGAPAAVVIDHDDLGRLAERVREIMRYWRRPRRRFGALGMEALEKTLGLRVEIRTPLKLQFDEEDRRIVELTEDQAYVLAYITKRHRAAVVGPAGSGKTLLALQVARKLAAGGNRTLLACFNRRLADYLRQEAGSTPNLDIFHFHDLAARLPREAHLEAPPVPEGDDAQRTYFERTLPEFLGKAAEVLGPRYDAMVVDEAQDFRAGWWPLLLRLHRRPDDGYLFLFSDSNQNLYGGRTPEELVETTVPLTANIRNTRPIHEFVSVFSKGTEPGVGKGPEGRPVEVLAYKDGADLARLLEIVLANLRQEGVPIDDIVLLTPARAAKSALRQRARIDGVDLSDEPEPGKLLASTVHGFKGLERPVVILAELGERGQDELAQYLYVGASRARNHLIVLATEPVAKELRALAGTAAA